MPLAAAHPCRASVPPHIASTQACRSHRTCRLRSAQQHSTLRQLGERRKAQYTAAAKKGSPQAWPRPAAARLRLPAGYFGAEMSGGRPGASPQRMAAANSALSGRAPRGRCGAAPAAGGARSYKRGWKPNPSKPKSCSPLCAREGAEKRAPLWGPVPPPHTSADPAFSCGRCVGATQRPRRAAARMPLGAAVKKVKTAAPTRPKPSPRLVAPRPGSSSLSSRVAGAMLRKSSSSKSSSSSSSPRKTAAPAAAPSAGKKSSALLARPRLIASASAAVTTQAKPTTGARSALSVANRTNHQQPAANVGTSRSGGSVVRVSNGLSATPRPAAASAAGRQQQQQQQQPQEG